MVLRIYVLAFSFSRSAMISSPIDEAKPEFYVDVTGLSTPNPAKTQWSGLELLTM